MIFKSPLISSGSGSIGGVTLSHNKGGQYFRRRAIPTNPNSTYQQAVRGVLNSLVNHWGNTLTAAQRQAWATYAANVPVLNALGDPIYLTALNHYVRCNTPRMQSGEAGVDDAPTVFNLGEFTPPSFAYDATAGEIDVTFDSDDDWANEDDAVMIISGSREQSPTINYFKGPYRFAANIEGDSTTPPTSPAALTAPFPCTAGNLCFVMSRVSRADGRLSMPFRGFGVSA